MAKMTAKAGEPKAPKGYDPSRDDERKWRAEDALRALERAEEVRRDKSLMRDVEACRQDKMRKLADIKVETAVRTIKAPK